MHYPEQSNIHPQVYPQLIIGRVTTLRPNLVRRLDHIKQIGALKVTSKPQKPVQPALPTPIGDVPGVAVTWDYTHSELVDKDLVIHDYVEIETQYGPSLVCNCTINDEVHPVLMGAKVIMNQIILSADFLPVSATIIFTGKYFLLK